MLGRRGPAQAAFTNPELRELGELAGADVIVDPADLELDPRSARPRSRTRDATRAPQRRDPARVRRARARRASRAGSCCASCVSPVEILGEGTVEAVEVVRNELVARRRRRVARGADRTRARSSRAASCSAASATAACALPGVPFDERRGVIPNDGGRVLDDDGEPSRGVYGAGWIKRGPSGVIGTNKKDAAETVDAPARGRRGGLARPPPTRDLASC